MQGFIWTCLCVTISLQLVFSADEPTPDLAAFMNIAKGLAGDPSLAVPEGNISQEVCRSSLKKELRYKKIIMLHEQVNLKLQSQFLEEIQACSNFRQSVRKLIAKYKKLKMELKQLRAADTTRTL